MKKDDRALDPDDPDRERLRRGYIADQFFVDALPPRPATEDAPPKPLTLQEEFRALRAFVKVLHRMDRSAAVALVRWLTARFGAGER